MNLAVDFNLRFDKVLRKNLRMLFLIFGVLLAILASSLVHAEANDENFKHFLKDIEKDIFPIVMANRNSYERNNAQSVKIEFVTDFYARSTVFASSSNNKIVVSSGFMWGLWAYSQAVMVESYTGQKYFREWYFHYLLTRHPLFWNGSVPKLPAEFYGLSESDTEKALNNPRLPSDSLFRLAVIEVMLHELGHIALNATYINVQSSAFKLQQEIRADNWSREASSDLDDTTGFGRIIALGYLHELERFYGFGNNIYVTHPSTQQRIKVYVDDWCASKKMLSDKVCTLYKSEYEDTFSTEMQFSKYKNRAAEGEAHAAIRLGDFYMEGKLVGKDFFTACQYYKKAYDFGDRNLGALNYAWCLGKGYLGQPKKVAAKTLLDKLEEKGWIYAKLLREGM